MKYLAYITLNIGKVVTILSLLIFLPFAYFSGFKLWESWGTIGNLFLLAIVLLIYRYISGCFSASTIKGMLWSVGLSIISSIFLIYLGVHNVSADASASMWLYLIPTIVATVYAIWAYNWVDNLISSEYASGITADGLLDSVFDNGIKGTFSGIMDDLEGNAFASASHGIYVYSNTSFIISMVIMLIMW